MNTSYTAFSALLGADKLRVDVNVYLNALGNLDEGNAAHHKQSNLHGSGQDSRTAAAPPVTTDGHFFRRRLNHGKLRTTRPAEPRSAGAAKGRTAKPAFRELSTLGQFLRWIARLAPQ
jgi:hypothetical protein